MPMTTQYQYIYRVNYPRFIELNSGLRGIVSDGAGEVILDKTTQDKRKKSGYRGLNADQKNYVCEKMNGMFTVLCPRVSAFPT